MLRFIARNFSVKLFLSYLIVIVVGTLVLASTTEFVVPEAFDQHMSSMGQMMMGGDLMRIVIVYG